MALLQIQAALDSIDQASFVRDYHQMPISDVQKRYSITSATLYKLLAAWGVDKKSKSRLALRANGKAKKPESKKWRYGLHGCNVACPGWKTCTGPAEIGDGQIRIGDMKATEGKARVSREDQLGDLPCFRLCFIDENPINYDDTESQAIFPSIMRGLE